MQSLVVLLALSMLGSMIPVGLIHAEETEEPQPEEVVELETDVPEQTTGNVEAQNEEEESKESSEEESSENDGEEGEDGGGDIIIETGDALSSAAAATEVNTNEVTTENASSTEEADETASSSPKFLFPHADTDTLDVHSTNTATTTTNASSSAGTGENEASGDGTTYIDTGDAIAYADVLNVVNTNIVNSDGLVKFINEVLGYKNFDLTDDLTSIFGGFGTSQSTPSCSLSNCGDGTTDATITNDNTAVINNNIDVIASTGSNRATGTNAGIETGDAYASANVVNVANTNIVDSNYLMLVFNNFGDYGGNIILPNSAVFSSLFGLGQGRSAATVESRNYADVTNNLNVGANTGGNTATGNNTFIDTGDASAIGSVYNDINSNLLNTNSFTMLIRVHGTWTGKINGLPDGMTWVQTPEGILLMNEGSAGNGTGDLSVSNNNSATINNNVNVYALTGDNKATGENAGIMTGNAHADASVINVANKNVVSSNWANFIFTIIGDWDGDISFGQHDLWLGVVASSEDNPIMPGSTVDYTFTVFNKGDIDATNVTLGGTLPNNTITFSDIDGGSGGAPVWNLGDIGAGETREFTRSAKVSNYMRSDNETPVPLVALVESDEDDLFPENNEDTVTVYVGQDRENNNSLGRRFPAKLDFTKTASQDFARPGDTVDYTITFYNRGGQLYEGVLVDILEDQDGNIIQEQSWDLGTLYNGEEIIVEYSLELSDALDDMVLTNSAQVLGFHGSDRKRYQIAYESPIVQHELTVGNPNVLGVQADFCPQYLTTYIRTGADNDSEEVTKLQVFLNEHMAANLEVTGYYDQSSELAVRSFQSEYAADILEPWGMTETSGYVYYTTQKKINEIYCDFEVEFPLSQLQLEEIGRYNNSETTLDMRFGDATPAIKEEEPDTLVEADDTEDVPEPEDTSLSQAQTPATPRNEDEDGEDEEDPTILSRIANFIFGFLPRATAGR